MSDFYCPYLGRRLPTEDGSPEHVVPLALGGSNGLVIVAEGQANNRLGTDVDGPTIDLYAQRRIEYDLRGHSGREPLFQQAVLVDGAPALWEMRRDGGGVRLKPKFESTPMPDGTTQFSISGEPEDVRRILDGMRKKHEAKGRTAAFTETVTTKEQPQVTGTFDCDLLALLRFQAKVALGVGHWLWGEPWSVGKGAAALRRALWSTTIDEVNANAPRHAVRAPADFRIQARPHEHLLLAVPAPARGTGAAFGLFLFGQPGFVLAATEAGDDVPAPEITAVVVDVTTRAVRRLTLRDLWTERRVELVQRQTGTSAEAFYTRSAVDVHREDPITCATRAG